MSARTKLLCSLAAAAIASVSCGDGIVDVPDTLSLPVHRVAFDTYSGHGCALDVDGAAWCWGSNWRGQLGDESANGGAMPVRVQGGHTFVSISVGAWTTCAIDLDGVAWCWGDNQYGELGAGWHAEAGYAAEPQRVLAPERLVSVSAGGSHTCGLAHDGTAYCWGSNHRGGVGSHTSSTVANTPTAVSAGVRFRALAAGAYDTCGVTAIRSLLCWGGEELDTAAWRPTVVPSSDQWADVHPNIAEGPNCGLTVAGDVKCWGVLHLTSEGGGSTPRQVVLHEAATPEPIGAPPAIAELAGVCANHQSGPAHCMSWQQAEVGNRWVAQPLAVGIEFVRVAGSPLSKCGMTADRELYCWGWNAVAELVPGDIPWADPFGSN